MRGLAHHTVAGEAIPGGSTSSKECASQCLWLSGLFSALPCKPCLPTWCGQRGVVLSLEGGRETGVRVFSLLCFRWHLQQGVRFLPGPGGPTWPAVQAPPLLLPLTSQVPLPHSAQSSHGPAALGIQPFPFVLLALGMGWVSDIGDL